MKTVINKIESIRDEEVVFNVVDCDQRVKNVIDVINEQYGNDYLVVKGVNLDLLSKVKFKSIEYFEYVNREIFVYCDEGVYVYKSSLVALKNELPSHFIQISKGVIVNKKMIKVFKSSFSGNLIAVLISGEQLVVSRKYVKELKSSI